MANRKKAAVVSLPQAQQVAIDAKGGESVITQPGMRPAEKTGPLVSGAPTPMVSGGAAIGMPRGVIGKVQGMADEPPAANAETEQTATQRLEDSLAALRTEVAGMRAEAAKGATHGRPAASQARPGTIGGLSLPSAARGASAVTRPSAFERWNAGLVVASDTNPNVITMYDVIGEDYWSGGGVTARSVTAKLKEIGSEADLEVHLNSPGGDMFEGIAIYNILAMHRGKITVKVLGLAASAASVIAMAGDEVQMGPGSFIMVHDCWVLASGNRHGFAETAEWLEPFDKAMADLYAKRTGKTPEETLAWMDKDGGEGTYFGVKEAIAAGLADSELGESVQESTKAAENGKVKSNLLKTELALCATMSRKDARALLSSVKAPTDSKPDAAGGTLPTDGKPDAAVEPPADTSWLGSATSLLATLRS